MSKKHYSWSAGCAFDHNRVSKLLVNQNSIQTNRLKIMKYHIKVKKKKSDIQEHDIENENQVWAELL